MTAESPEADQTISATEEDQAILEDNSISGIFDHSDSVFTTSLSENGKFIVTGGADDRSILAEINSGRIENKTVLNDSSDSVVDCCFNFKGDLFITASMDGIANVYNTSGEMLAKLEGPELEINWIKPHKNKNILLVGSADKTCWVFDLDRLDFMSVFTRHLGPLTCGDFIEEDKAITCSSAGEVYIWELSDGEVKKQFLEIESEINCLAVLKNAFFIGLANGKCKLYSIRSEIFVCNLEAHTASVESLGVCLPQGYIFTSGLDGQVIVSDIGTGRNRFKCNLESPVIKALSLKKKPFLICCLENGNIGIIDFRSGRVVKTLSGHTERVLDLSTDGEERYLATASDDGTCLLFEI